MLTTVKRALRISHDYLDDTLWDDIQAAQAELVRAGVSSDAAQNTAEPLIKQAVITYVRAAEAKDTDESAKYMQSFQSQLDNLRKSSAYMVEDDDGE